MIRGYNGQWYKLANMSILQVIGRPMPGGPEGMVCVQKKDNENGDYVVWVWSLEGAAHLIPVELEHRWIINNRIDYHTWNEWNDGW